MKRINEQKNVGNTFRMWTKYLTFLFVQSQLEKALLFPVLCSGVQSLNHLILANVVHQTITQVGKSIGRRTLQVVGGQKSFCCFVPSLAPGWALWTYISFIYLLHNVTSLGSCSVHSLPTNINIKLFSWSPVTAESYHQSSLSPESSPHSFLASGCEVTQNRINQ